MEVQVAKSIIDGIKVTKLKHDFGHAIVVDRDVMQAARLVNFEKVTVFNKRTKSLYDVTILASEPDSGDCLTNLSWKVGDEIEIVSYTTIPIELSMSFRPISPELINNRLKKSDLITTKPGLKIN